ncbi:MAG: hypothetical protein ACI9DE_002182, partial [Halioglobus sp.]
VEASGHHDDFDATIIVGGGVHGVSRSVWRSCGQVRSGQVRSG